MARVEHRAGHVIKRSDGQDVQMCSRCGHNLGYISSTQICVQDTGGPVAVYTHWWPYGALVAVGEEPAVITERGTYPACQPVLDPVAFAEIMLGEDEAYAIAASFGPDGAPWTADLPGMVHIDAQWISQDWTRSSLRAYVASSDTDAYRQHIARHDPARALRDVETGRRTLARHTACVRGLHAGPWPCPELADLLYRWADDPRHNPDWGLLAAT